MVILPEEQAIPLNDEAATAARMNNIVEQGVLMAPDQYMWLHRRFKTRPEGQPALY